MAIVSDLPFELRFNTSLVKVFETDENAVFSDDFPAASIYENDEVDILFNSYDTNARLYLDALDIVPNENGLVVDEEGNTYRKVSKNPWPLFRNTDDYDALRIDSFLIVVHCQNQKYFGRLDVLPKQLEYSEWRMMRDDLEKEINGLAQDIVRRSIGLGSNKEGIIPPDQLYNFFVIKKYSKQVLAALIGIKDAPKYQIVNEYIEEEAELVHKMDAVTIRKYLRHGGVDATYSVPQKHISYDIPENQLLKLIITLYDRELRQFVSLLEKIKDDRKKQKIKEHRQYRVNYDRSVDSFLVTARKLQGVSSIIKAQSWYGDVSPSYNGIVPHSFVLDARYGVIYKMYQELRHKNTNIQFDPHYSYAWKKSSSLYEMWCYLKICRALSEGYNCQKGFWEFQYGKDQLFPYLGNGTCMSFVDNDVQLNVIFDQFVPRSESKTSLENSPFWCLGAHRRPDITIDMYDVRKRWYLGTIIIECKYRKLNSFWKSNQSSRPQIQAYYTDNKSKYIYGLENAKEPPDIRPVHKVIVLTPDVQGRGENAREINMVVVPLKPGSEEMVAEVTKIIEEKLQYSRRQCDKFSSFRLDE